MTATCHWQLISLYQSNGSSYNFHECWLLFVRLEQYKWKAVVTEIKRIHREGRPVLVGTTSVEKSEVLSEMLAQEGIKHQVRVCVCVC